MTIEDLMRNNGELVKKGTLGAEVDVELAAMGVRMRFNVGP